MSERHPQLSRRKFLEHTGLTAAAALLPSSEESPSPEYLKLCQPNPDAGAVNLSVVPGNVYLHHQQEVLSMNVNFDAMWRQDTWDHVNRETGQGKLWGYGQGLKEAIGRGQRVFLVLDFPWNTDKAPTPLEEWTKYVAALALEFKGALFIMDNELDTREKKFWREKPEEYTRYYLAAAEAIRKASLASKILFPAESYKGDSQLTRKMLKAISPVVFERELFPFNRISSVDGLAVHVFVRAGLIRERIKLFQGIGVPGIQSLPLYIRELGKTEGAILTPEEQQWAVIQGMATTLACIPQEAVCATWHAAFIPNFADPTGHSLTYIDAKGNLQKYPALDAFWQVCRLLHHDVTCAQQNGLTIVSGRTSEGDKTAIVWNNLYTPGRSEPRYYRGRELWSSSNPAVEGKPEIIFEKFRYRKRNFPWWL